MKLSKEVWELLDIYKLNWSKLYTCTIWDNIFYGNEYAMLNSKLFKHEETLVILQTLELEDVTESVKNKILLLDEKDYTMEDFTRFNHIGNAKQVGIWRFVLWLKKFDQIRKKLEDYNVNVKIWELFIFNWNGVPLILSWFETLVIQTSLIK